jgi:hypothetical protein
LLRDMEMCEKGSSRASSLTPAVGGRCCNRPIVKGGLVFLLFRAQRSSRVGSTDDEPPNAHGGIYLA